MQRLNLRAIDNVEALLPDSPELRTALLEANAPTMLAAYVWLTHDEAILETFRPLIKPAFSWPPTEIPLGVGEQLADAMLHALTTPGVTKTEPPDRILMKKIMSVCVGEEVDAECLDMVYDQCGFAPWIDRSARPGREQPLKNFKVLVIGAGLTGMAAAMKLTEAGYDHIVIEKNADVGGTWFENRYPGVGVDTPSHFYSFSWEIWTNWSHYHPKGADMQRYLLEVADKYDIRRNVQFNTRVQGLVYDEITALWTVTVQNAEGETEELVANAVINGHGPVNRYKWPDIEGLDRFNGPVVHTATWPDDLSLKGKRVAVIGTAASASQVVGAIAAETSALTVYQRTKHWVIHNPEIAHEVSGGMKWALAHIPSFKQWFRFRVYWANGDGLFSNVLRDPAWDGNDLAVSENNEMARQWALGILQVKFPDRPDLIEKLTPDFPIFSKRIVLDNGWLEALKLPQTELNDRGIDRIVPEGVIDKDGNLFECDVIVCATGFNVARMTGDLEIIGRDGANLGELWGDEDARSYLGMCVPGFPNYFHTVGPNSAPNHAAGQNLVSECQINWIIEALDKMVAASAKSFEVKQEAFDAWNAKVDERMKQMIWTHPKANSYYNTSKGRVFLSWPWRLVDYFNATRAPEDGSYLLR